LGGGDCGGHCSAFFTWLRSPFQVVIARAKLLAMAKSLGHWMAAGWAIKSSELRFGILWASSEERNSSDFSGDAFYFLRQNSLPPKSPDGFRTFTCPGPDIQRNRSPSVSVTAACGTQATSSPKGSGTVAFAIRETKTPLNP